MAKKRAVDGLITEVTEKIMEMMVELGLENVGDEVPVPEEDSCKSGDESTILRCNSLPPKVEDIKAEVQRPQPPPDYVPKCGRLVRATDTPPPLPLPCTGTTLLGTGSR